jgi:prevent-host-death family protein
MTRIRICVSEAEAVRDFGSVLARVGEGEEVIIGTKGRPVAIVSPAEPRRRSISECIALLPEDSTAVMDDNFAKDVQAAIESLHESVDSHEWD